MCVATPLKIKKIDGSTGVVNHDGKDFDVSLHLIPKAKVGDWILAHGEIAISIISSKDAKDILGLISKSQESSC